ncbi:MAG: hypothetical protein GX661_00665, partial [Acholeplasmataceae bacterium]|nr:hypothetical protein [Acholeplasmataceae bacterium]
MKKSLIVFFLSVLTLFILGYAAGEMVKATDGAELKGKIVVHYMSWENEAKEVGIHVWGNGTGAQESAPYAARAE